MITSRNMVLLEGNLVADATKPENGPLLLSIAVNFGGSDSTDKEKTVGYFDIKFWLNESDFSPKAVVSSVAKAFEEGQLKKGTRISVVGQLKQERWATQDNKTASKVVIQAETIGVMFAGTKAPEGSTSTTATAASSSFTDIF